MDKFIKWFFVVGFLILSILYGFGVWQATNGIVAVWSLMFAYLAYKAKVVVGAKKTE